MRLCLPDGRMMPASGQVPVRASRSVLQANTPECQMNATYGRSSPGSSASANLQQCLENRLVALMAGRGSRLYDLTWKLWDMPSGPPICALRASGRRTSDNDCTSWPSPIASGNHNDATGSSYCYANVITLKLPGAAKLATWPTPNTPSGGPNSKATETHRGGRDLDGTVLLAGLASWATPDGPARITTSGEILIGSDALMDGGGRLNPAHSRWLMGYPRAWDACTVMAMPLSRRSRRRS